MLKKNVENRVSNTIFLKYGQNIPFEVYYNLTYTQSVFFKTI